MKKIILFLSVCLVLFSCRQTKQQVPEILNGRVLILGDSITQDGRYVSVIENELFKNYPDVDFYVISIGLSSETVSGLTEPGHPYPRPNLHERLGRALAKLKPKTVVACYGMNDGIYYPQSKERFQAFKDGIQKLITDVKAAGARLIILTPPIFDPTVIPNKVVGQDAKHFGYSTPYVGYNDVLADYSRWLMSLDVPGVKIIDLNTPMLEYAKKQRETEPGFAFSKDGVHPQLTGHVLMAQLFLRGVGLPVSVQDPQRYAEQLQQSEIYKLVDKRRRMRSMAWLLDVGFKKPGKYEGLPVEEAEQKAKEMREQIRKLIGTSK